MSWLPNRLEDPTCLFCHHESFHSCISIVFWNPTSAIHLTAVSYIRVTCHAGTGRLCETESRQGGPPDSLDGAGLLFGLGRCECQLSKQYKCLAIQLVGRRKKVKDHP